MSDVINMIRLIVTQNSESAEWSKAAKKRTLAMFLSIESLAERISIQKCSHCSPYYVGPAFVAVAQKRVRLLCELEHRSVRSTIRKGFLFLG